MKKIVIFHGTSSSGKTEGVNFLVNDYRFVPFHPYGFRKRELERLYGCPSLDTRKGKEFIPWGLSINMQAMMVEDYHHKAKVDPYYTTRNLVIEIPDLIEKKKSIAINALRNREEVTYLIPILEKAIDQGYELTLILLQRESATRETSDSLTEKLWLNLVESLYLKSEVFCIDNNGTLSDLKKTIVDRVFPGKQYFSFEFLTQE